MLNHFWIWGIYGRYVIYIYIYIGLSIIYLSIKYKSVCIAELVNVNLGSGTSEWLFHLY